MSSAHATHRPTGHFPTLVGHWLPKGRNAVFRQFRKTYAAWSSCEPCQLLIRRGDVLCLFCVKRKGELVSWLIIRFLSKWSVLQEFRWKRSGVWSRRPDIWLSEVLLAFPDSSCGSCHCALVIFLILGNTSYKRDTFLAVMIAPSTVLSFLDVMNACYTLWIGLAVIPHDRWGTRRV